MAMTVQSEAVSARPASDFVVIPVIDLKEGLVVHARAGKQAHAGKRAEYRPIATPFGPPHDAVALARALLGITFSPILYVADLDSILGRGNNFDLCRELSDAFPDTTLWIDAGFSDVTDCAFWLPLGATLVIGSESVASLAAWDNIRSSFGNNVVLSLDFDEQGLRGPQDVMSNPALWPERLILMSLGRVGTEGGPDLERLQATQRLAGERAVFVAGGVSNLDDVVRAAGQGACGVLAATALHSGAITQKEIAALLRERRYQIEGG
jgi:HisA/HisF family protein